MMIYPMILSLLLLLLGCEVSGRDSSSKDPSSSSQVSSSSGVPAPSFAYELQKDTLIRPLNSTQAVRSISYLGYQYVKNDSSVYVLDSALRKDTISSTQWDTIPKFRGMALINQFGTDLRVEAYLGQGPLWFQDGKIKGNQVIRLNPTAQILKVDSTFFVPYPAHADTSSQILWVLGLEKAGEYVYLNSWNDKLFPLYNQGFVINAEAEISRILFTNSKR